MELKLFGNGSVTFIPPIEAREEQRETTASDFGTVTNISAAVPGRPGHFEVSFMIQFSHGAPGLECLNTFQLATLVATSSRTAGYSAVETEAAQRMPALLRELADALDRELAQT